MKALSFEVDKKLSLYVCWQFLTSQEKLEFVLRPYFKIIQDQKQLTQGDSFSLASSHEFDMEFIVIQIMELIEIEYLAKCKNSGYEFRLSFKLYSVSPGSCRIVLYTFPLIKETRPLIIQKIQWNYRYKKLFKSWISEYLDNCN
ncbi:hypothetical protein J0X14_04460 [Muricauda sp. CAU 1633]|uniref:hypothetical protein n=1 Tax=Allomuricauda sp. CAU 1633 TaxID=2816036 RepID=UPI001A9007B9|nr:hypothetical protein [Muricauda sp. CAU 1633]MBO0321541.1 hypothetical protein [Muricauda sp. CAU 1633]